MEISELDSIKKSNVSSARIKNIAYKHFNLRPSTITF